MRRFTFFLALLLTVGFIVVLERPDLLSSEPIPKMGRFLSPFTGFWKNATPDSYFPEKEVIDNQQLIAPVTVQTDTLDVPHIFAQNMDDAMYVQGYLTARDRLWQMDFSARATAGRLAELFGPDLIPYDTHQRRIGFIRSAQNAINEWGKNPAKMHFIERYCDGVNAYIDQLKPGEQPLEFKLMNYEPEHWTPLKVALLFKAMAKTLNFRYHDIEMTNLRAALGQKAFDFLYPEYNPRQKPIVPDIGQWDSLSVRLAAKHPSWYKNQAIDSALTTSLPFRRRKTPRMSKPNIRPLAPKESLSGIGSNNWAVSGKKTKSGQPILCNDPHLSLTFPSIWYLLQIHTPEMNSMGVSLAGIPGIIIGFNENIAWGVTNASLDVTDWYRITWTNKNHTRYLLDKEEIPVQILHDTILVKGQKPIFLATKMTDWGPIVYDQPNKPYSGMAMKWFSNEASTTFDLNTFLGLMKAKDYDDYVTAAKDFTHPAQNLIFASTQGDIAIRVQGRFPIKNPEQGRFILDGSKSANDWHGYIPQDEIPQQKNPNRGFVFSANQNSAPLSYPYYFSGEFSDYRCRSIYNQLKSMSNITPKDMMRMQNDDYSYKAKDALPLMLAALDTSELQSGAFPLIKQLKNWDYHFRKDRLEPVLFTEWFNKMKERTWDEIAQLPDSMAVLYPEDWRMIELMSDTTHPYFDLAFTDEVEGFSDIATLSFGDMMESLAEKIASKKYHWKDYNQPSINHLARLPAFSRKNMDVSGQANTINAVNGGVGPSWRMVVELTKPIKAYGVFPGGSSGNPGSPYYDNMVDDWATGKYYELMFLKNLDGTAQGAFLKTEVFQ